jgi:hypothetical protein
MTEVEGISAQSGGIDGATWDPMISRVPARVKSLVTQ